MKKQINYERFSVSGGVLFVIGILGSRALENAWMSSWIQDIISNLALYNAFMGFAQGVFMVFLAASIYLNVRTLVRSRYSL